MPPKLPSFQEWNVWITDLDERWNLKSEILAMLSPFTPILRRWRPQDPACHLQRWGRLFGWRALSREKGVSHVSGGCLICVEKPMCFFIPYTGLPWITLLLKVFCCFTVWGSMPVWISAMITNPCRWKRGELRALFNMNGSSKGAPLAAVVHGKKRWQILARWFGRFVVESLEGFWKDEVPFGLFTGKLYTILFRGIWKAHTLQRFQASPQEEYSDAFIEFL